MEPDCAGRGSNSENIIRFSDLVEDLFHQIFLQLSFQDLLRVRKTCRNFRRILAKPEFWKLKISFDFPDSSLMEKEMTQDTYYLANIDDLHWKIRMAISEKMMK